jgi:hypothetical protein
LLLGNLLIPPRYLQIVAVRCVILLALRRMR